MESNDQIEVSPFVYRGLENILDGEYESALSDFDKSLELDGEDVMVLAYKARLLNKMDRDSEALDVWERVLGLQPKWEYAQLNKASSLVNMGKNEQALLAYMLIAGDDPFGPFAELSIMNQAFVYYNLGKYEHAVEACELVKESGKFDNDPRFWNLWVDSLGPTDAGIDKLGRVIKEGLKIFPKDTGLTKSMCIYLNWQGKFKESLSLCNKVLDDDSSDVNIWLYKALSLAELGDADGAYDAFFVAISIDRTNLKENQREEISKEFLKLNDERFQKLIDKD